MPYEQNYSDDSYQAYTDLHVLLFKSLVCAHAYTVIRPTSQLKRLK